MRTLKENYQRPDQFQCIFDLYEDLSRHLVNLKLSHCDWQGLKLIETVEITDESCLLSDPTVESLYTALHYYSSYHMENKSTEYQNLRKASMLGKLYLLHKLCLSNLIGKPSSGGKNVFYETCLSYAKQYA